MSEYKVLLARPVAVVRAELQWLAFRRFGYLLPSHPEHAMRMLSFLLRCARAGSAPL